MWKNLNKLSTILNKTVLSTPETCLHQQLRTTYVLKRRNPPMLHGKGASHPKRLKNKHYIYDLVQDTNQIKQPDLDLILLSYVEGLGNVGERVSVRPNFGYEKLLMPGLAVYATPENSEKFEKIDVVKEKKFSSPTVERTISILSRMTLSVIMNKEIPWTLEPWHVRASFRKCGYHVPDNCIALPKIPIKGPDMRLENKGFTITVTINNTEKVDVKCRIHHWSTEITERLPYVNQFWKIPTESVFESHNVSN